MNGVRWRRSTLRTLLACVGLGVAAIGVSQVQRWVSLAADGIHDPLSPAITQLQEPGAALSVLADRSPDTVGNQVRWMHALETGAITPRAAVEQGGELELRDTEILMPRTGEMPLVKFPHRAHTQWLACVNCHDHLFARKAGATLVNMAMILNGDKCGLCHGAVAFPLTECDRCHSVPRQLGPIPAPGVPPK